MDKKFYFYYIPLFYSLRTRFYGPKKVLGWVASYFIPVLLVANIYFSFDLFITLKLVFFFYNVYEIGYLFNDHETIKNENKPTLRLNSSEFSYYENNRVFIYSFRLLLFFVSHYFLDNDFLIILYMTLVVFSLHNLMRNRFNILTYHLLVIFRYFGFFFSVMRVETCLLLWILYPVSTTIEFSSKKRFDLFKKSLDIDKFRVLYYLSVIVILFIFRRSYEIKFLIPFVYFLLYRFCIFIFFRRKSD